MIILLIIELLTEFDSSESEEKCRYCFGIFPSPHNHQGEKGGRRGGWEGGEREGGMEGWGRRDEGRGDGEIGKERRGKGGWGWGRGRGRRRRGEEGMERRVKRTGKGEIRKVKGRGKKDSEEEE